MVDSYRPSRAKRDAPPDRPQTLADRMTYNTSDGDSYRPGSHSQSEFTFESNHPAPRFPPSGPANQASRAPPRRNRGGANQRGRVDHHGSSHRGGDNSHRPRRGGFKKAPPHRRALLLHHDDGLEHTYGVSDGSSRFRNIDELSDHDEVDMEVESDASNGDQGAKGNDGNPKVARTQVSRSDGDSVPRWSNPDPYTALPPPSESTGVKKDVVQLIRKAKNQAAEKAVGINAVAANDDFISFGDDDGAAASPSLEIYEDEDLLRAQEQTSASMRAVEGSLNELTHTSINSRDDHRPETALPSKPRRERGHKRKYEADVAIKSEWMATRRLSPTPWVVNHEAYKHLANDPEKWLHNEILDFYDFVAPQPFEHDARHKLVQRISEALGSQRWFPHDNGRILCFGSYPAGLYLPTADMDLVYASERHYNGGPAVLQPSSDKAAIKKTLFKASRRLQQVGISTNPTVIHQARVPIIKFKDRLTGIDVDISFENLSGVQAQATFDEWKAKYPDMIYMVALVKQVLVMRGLNEVHTGGLGGFSIICLIVSYIQHNERAQNLGQCFVGFLEYYGKIFDLSRKRIRMNPAAVLDKTMYGIDDRLEKPNGLSIQDPNRPDNNISGGSHKAVEAFKAFAAAHDTLTDRMEASRIGQDVGPSILECVIGGNYESYIKQRRHLKSL